MHRVAFEQATVSEEQILHAGSSAQQEFTVTSQPEVTEASVLRASEATVG